MWPIKKNYNYLITPFSWIQVMIWAYVFYNRLQKGVGQIVRWI